MTPPCAYTRIYTHAAHSANPAVAKDKVEYLTEPTPEFKAMQERAMAFEKAEVRQKREATTPRDPDYSD